jgi:hypothetical protein
MNRHPFYDRPAGFRFRCSYQSFGYFDHVRTGREYRYDNRDPDRLLRSYDQLAPDDVQAEWRMWRVADYLAFVSWLDRRGYWSPVTPDIIAGHYPDVLAELAGIIAGFYGTRELVTS